MFYAIYGIANGADEGLMMLGGVGAITGNGGRMPDNGIPRPALGAYKSWINAVRVALGAKNETDLVLVDDEARNAALLKTQDSYAEYKRARDKAEFGMWLWAHPGERQTPGHLPLARETTYTVWSVAIDSLFPANESLRRLAIDRSQQLLVCAYGPEYDANGAERFTLKKLWYQHAPANIDQLLALDTQQALKYLGNKGYDKCPDTDGEMDRDRASAAAVYESPQYATARNETVAKERAMGGDQRKLGAVCREASMKLPNTETGPVADLVYSNIVGLYQDVCGKTPSNIGSADVSVDSHALCDEWNRDLDAKGARTTQANSLVNRSLVASYDRHCSGGSADFSATAPKAPPKPAVVQSRNIGAASTAAQDAQDAHTRMCAQMYQNVQTARARAHGLRESLAVNSMEASVKRQCGSVGK
jgi:hypothetical protein